MSVIFSKGKRRGIPGFGSLGTWQSAYPTSRWNCCLLPYPTGRCSYPFGRRYKSKCKLIPWWLSFALHITSCFSPFYGFNWFYGFIYLMYLFVLWTEGLGRESPLVCSCMLVESSHQIFIQFILTKCKVVRIVFTTNKFISFRFLSFLLTCSIFKIVMFNI